MNDIKIKLPKETEWARRIVKIPVSARNITQCVLPELDRRDEVPIGALCVVGPRNLKNVWSGIVLPAPDGVSGCLVPTSERDNAPAVVWFQMLKVRLRYWLSLSPAGRVVTVTETWLDALQGDGDEAARLMVSVFEQARALALDELPPGAKEDDILASFYDWLVVTSTSTGKPQRELKTMILGSLQENRPVEVSDLDRAAFVKSGRFLCLD